MKKLLFILLLVLTQIQSKALIITNQFLTGQEVTNAILALLAGFTNSFSTNGSTNIFIVTNVYNITTNTIVLRSGTGPVLLSSNAPNDYTISVKPIGVSTNVFISVSAKGTNNSLSSTYNDGAMFGPDTAGTLTYGIQEAINFLLQPNRTNPAPSGGTIKLGSGVFYTTTNIVTPQLSNGFALIIEGPGINAGGVLGMTSNEVFTIGIPHSGNGVTFVMRDMFVSSITNACMALLKLKGYNFGGDFTTVGGVGKSEITRCWFTHWTRATNYGGTGPIVFTPDIGNAGSLATAMPNNLIGIDIDENFSNLQLVKDCEFNFLGCAISVACDHARIENNIMGLCGQVSAAPSNSWPNNTVYKAGSAIVYTEPTPNKTNNTASLGLINSPQHQLIDRDQVFINCDRLYTFNLQSGYNRYIIKDMSYENGIAGAMTILAGFGITLSEAHFVGYQGFSPATMGQYLITNRNDWSTAYNQPATTNFTFFNYTNGLFTSGNLAASLAISAAKMYSSNLFDDNTVTIIGSNNPATVYLDHDFRTTNTASTTVSMALARQLIKASGAVTLTGPSGINNTKEQSTVVFIDPGGADRTLNIPTGWRTTDGFRSYIIGSTNIGVLNLESYGGLYTNASFVNVW